jgi:plastocyanin
MRRHALLAAGLAAALLTGCGDGGGKAAPPAAAPATQKITIKDFLYSPDPSTVKAGTKIAVSNADSTPHTLTDKAGTPAFDSGTIKGKASGSVTFTKTGTFTYYCQFHPTMKGTVTVVP